MGMFWNRSLLKTSSVWTSHFTTKRKSCHHSCPNTCVSGWCNLWESFLSWKDVPVSRVGHWTTKLCNSQFIYSLYSEKNTLKMSLKPVLSLSILVILITADGNCCIAALFSFIFFCDFFWLCHRCLLWVEVTILVLENIKYSIFLRK